MPVKLYQRVNEKIVEKTNDNRVNLLNINTKSGMSGYQLKKRMIKDYFIHGGGYAYIKKSGQQIVGLYYTPNHNINIQVRVQTLAYRSYKFLIGGEEFDPEDFLKLLRDSLDGVSGHSVILEFQRLLSILFQGLKYTFGDVVSGGVPKFALKMLSGIASETRDETMEKIQKGIDDLCQNDTVPGVVFDDDVELIKLYDGDVKQDITARLKMSEESLRKLFHISDDFYSTFREAVLPVIKAFEAALNMNLLTVAEQSKYFFEFDTSEVLRANIKERYEAHSIAIKTGIKTINEVRKDENLPEIKGLDHTRLGLDAALYKDDQVHVINTGSSIDLTSKSTMKGGDEIEAGERKKS